MNILIFIFVIFIFIYILYRFGVFGTDELNVKEKGGEVYKDKQVDVNIREVREYIVFNIVNLALSLIGEKTKMKNYFLTKKSEQNRCKVEKGILDMLFINYKDKNTQDILLKHFRVFKIACVHSIFHLLLIRQNKELCNECSIMFDNKLESSMLPSEWEQISEYSNLFLDQFDNYFKEGLKIQYALPYVFWNVARNKYPTLFSWKASLSLMSNHVLFHYYLFLFTTIEDIMKGLLGKKK